MRRGVENLLGQLLPLAAVALGLYWIYKRLPSFAQISNAGQEAVNLLLNPTVASQAVSTVVLPDGYPIAVSDLLAAGGSIDRDGFFTYGGQTYQISGRDPASGYYTSKRIVT